MGKRGNGEGTISRRSDGRWMARLSLADGTRQTFYGQSREEVAGALADAQADLRAGRLVTSSRRSLADWLDQWLADEVKPNTRDSPRTYEAYEGAVRIRIKPLLGKKRLDQLIATPGVIQRAYAQLAEKYAPKTVNFTHNVLHLALEAARRTRLISRNPLDDIRPPKRPGSHAEDRVLELDDLGVVLQAMAGHPFEPAWRFVLGTGVRWGEAAGLRWADVSLVPGREHVTVRRAATRVKGGMLLKEPKTRKGRRQIPLMDDTVQALELQKARCQELERAAVEWVRNDLVFPNESGRPLRNNRVLELFKTMQSTAGIDPPRTLRDLRHTYATLHLGLGSHVRVTQDLLGHARSDMTLDTYTSSVPAATWEAVGRLGEAFARARHEGEVTE
jgi:integrase